MAKCPNCGKKISAEDKFCEDCGTPITVAEEPKPQPVYTASSDSSAPPVYYSGNKKWKIIVGILSPLLLISIVLTAWFGVQYANTKADYDSLKSDNLALQSLHENLQGEYNSLSSDFEDFQENLSEVATNVDLYLDVFRFLWCAEDEIETDYLSFIGALSDAVDATEDGVFISAFDNWVYCTTHCDDYEYMYERALIEGLATELETIGCSEWSWIVGSGDVH